VSGCPIQPGIEVDFTTNPDILRGTWSVDIADSPSAVTLALSADYIDETRYAVSGTWGSDDEPTLTLEGTVYGDRVTFLKPQTTNDPVSKDFLADLKDDTGVVRQLCAASNGSGLPYYGFMGPPGSFRYFPDTKTFVCNGIKGTQRIVIHP